MNNGTSHNDLVDTVINLQARGYHYDFISDRADIICLQCADRIKQGDFDIIERYRYPDIRKGNKMRYIFAIQLRNSDIKGILMNAKGLNESVS